MSATATAVRRVLASLAGCLLLAGCVSLPDEGPVRTGEHVGARDEGNLFPYDPRPPQEGEQPIEIVRHFLDAMHATPTSSVVARQFLTVKAQAQWRPDRQMITYADFEAPVGTDRVRIQFNDANSLDAAGRWSGALGEEESELSFELTREDGEWRISGLPDATIVSEEFFAARYQQLALYFFDPTVQVLVPEPVFVPRGGQLATALVRGLLRGPGSGLDGVSQTFIPAGMNLDLSVPVEDGLATVSLRGDAVALDAERVRRMAVQFAWTLRQDPSVRQVQLVVNDTPVTVEDTAGIFDVDTGAEFDPAGPDASPDLLGLRDGRLVSVVGATETATGGPFGRTSLGLRSVAVNLAGNRAAGVAGGGTTLLEGSVRRGDGAGARTLLAGATDLLPPAWDHADRVWSVDRTADGAVLRVSTEGGTARVDVDGITGEQVTAFLVSLDGSRLVAAVRTPGGDEIRISRLAGAGATVRATGAQRLPVGLGEGTSITDIAWQSPTRVLVLQDVAEGLSQVSSVPVDGSPTTSGAGRGEGVVRHDLVQLVASVAPEAPVLAVDSNGTVHELGGDRGMPLPDEGLASLGFGG
ncbi:LpqB family beta-propeller domain-containing protein [Nocardioides sp. AE5]|uniref:LpqB family beta-propeller domain-containing protein n=1 Tax=Nocardioides sp. AE5 TaxID=2962573 RepID=UPI002881F878|nr:LpqB family beta-propeller domain-containing protein [Nocardioides sp. AE5]MDT0202097.1 LpqB family beta-propeller domain-containing protein [Nocardioides sp. AE5]